MASRKEVKEILDKYDLKFKFTLRTIDFTDLARDSIQECIVRLPSGAKPDWGKYELARIDLKPFKVILHMNYVE